MTLEIRICLYGLVTLKYFSTVGLENIFRKKIRFHICIVWSIDLMHGENTHPEETSRRDLSELLSRRRIINIVFISLE